MIDPTTAEFNPSADHDAVVDGVPVVTVYRLGFYLLGAISPFQDMSLGKPTPAGDGRIRVVFTGLLGAVPTPGINYVARVSAIGPGGLATSEPSNVFSFSAPTPCTAGASPATQSLAANGGTATVSVTTGAGCGWNATSNAGWITITAGSSGSGNGTVTYSVAANIATFSRSGTLTVAGRTVTVNQSGAACSFNASPASQSIAAAGGTGTFSVTTTSGCGWTATSNAAWLTVPQGHTGAGNGTVTFAAAANTGAARSGTLTVAGRTVTVTQSGACSYTASPTSQNIAAAGGTGTVQVTTNSACWWTVTSSAAWLTVPQGHTGTGNGTVTFSATANTGAARSGTLNISGTLATVSQASGITPPSAPTNFRFVTPSP